MKVWVLVGLVGCAPARPEKLDEPRWIRHPEQDKPTPPPRVHVQLVAPPDIDLSAFTPDFHDELRWPLTPMNHPVMEPKFPIAQEFAQPGVGWMELCSSGVTSRYGGDKELLSYLRGWCKAVEGDTDAACSNLAPLMTSTKPRLEAAVRNDLANILAQGHADKAEHYIQVHQLRDVAMLDLLTANYVEVGTTDDALAVNRNAIDSDDHATPATKCMRWTRQIVLLGDRLSPLLKDIEAYATAPKNPDATCKAEYGKLLCWAQNRCTGTQSHGGVLFDDDIINGLRNWSSHVSSIWWWELARTVNLELGMPHAGSVFSNAELAEIEIAAMENARALERSFSPLCSDDELKTLATFASTLRPNLDAALTARLAALETSCD